MKVLDLFCGGGGASVGISWAGHEVEGVDISEQKEYPFTFYKANALEFILDGYDAFFASPPCQGYTKATAQWEKRGYVYPKLIDQVRDRLLATGKPFVIENVMSSPLRKDLYLCMSMFDDGSRKYTVRRHRKFEIYGFRVPQPEHNSHTGYVGDGRVLSVFGHGGGKRYNHCTSDMSAWKEAMHIDWINKRHTLAEAIPPDYTQYIFSYLGET
jgi:hypothetical protein